MWNKDYSKANKRSFWSWHQHEISDIVSYLPDHKLKEASYGKRCSSCGIPSSASYPLYSSKSLIHTKSLK